MDGRNRVNLGSGDHYAFEIRRLGRVQNPDYRAEPILVFSLWFHVVMSGPWLAAWEAHLNYRLGHQADRVKWLIVLSKKAVNGGEGRGLVFRRRWWREADFDGLRSRSPG